MKKFKSIFKIILSVLCLIFVATAIYAEFKNNDQLAILQMCWAIISQIWVNNIDT